MRVRTLLVAGLLLAGCSTSGLDRPDVEAEAMANPETALLRAMTRVNLATAAMRSASPRAEAAPAELQRPITWNWSGPLDEAAKALAERVGYSYAAPPPDMPAMPKVAVQANGTPVLEVFRSLGVQAGDRATLMVDPDRRMVQVKPHV